MAAAATTSAEPSSVSRRFGFDYSAGGSIRSGSNGHNCDNECDKFFNDVYGQFSPRLLLNHKRIIKIQRDAHKQYSTKV